MASGNNESIVVGQSGLAAPIHTHPSPCDPLVDQTIRPHTWYAMVPYTFSFKNYKNTSKGRTTLKTCKYYIKHGVWQVVLP